MARRHLTPKQKLGQAIPESSIAIQKQLNATLMGAAASPMVAAVLAGGRDASPAQPAAEASLVEDMAVAMGAEILFNENRVGPITALSIILIPDENRENRRVAALAATFGFVAQLSSRKKIAVAVPQGYVTDFASIPGFVQWLISPFGKHSEAAVVHDWLYTLGDKKNKKGRRLADLTFKRALKIVGVGFFRRNIMYLAVRAGGASGYGLESDYDFRDLEKLKRRDPMPERNSFTSTWKEMDIPKPLKKQKGGGAAAPPPPAQAAPVTRAEAKQHAQETMVATKTE
ncbi:MAG: DUF1353 domain-containing protein [Hyphomonadaceae bacterium]